MTHNCVQLSAGEVNVAAQVELTAVDDCVGVYTMQSRLLDYFLKDLVSVHILADMV